VHRVLAELGELGYVEQEPTRGATDRRCAPGSSAPRWWPTCRSSRLQPEPSRICTPRPVRPSASSCDRATTPSTSTSSSRPDRCGSPPGSAAGSRCPSQPAARHCSPPPTTAPRWSAGGAPMARAGSASTSTRRVKELAAARRRGYAIATSARGVTSLAAAVLDRDDRPAAALAVSAPTELISTGNVATRCGRGGLHRHPAERVVGAAVSTGRPEPVRVHRRCPTADIDPEVRELARRHVLDTLASVVACRDLEPAVVARRYALANSAGRASTILGTHRPGALVDAVFAGAMAGHGAEINDFMPSVFVQPGSRGRGHRARPRRGSGPHGRRGGASRHRRLRAGGPGPRALGTDNLRRAGMANHGVGPVFGAASTAASLVGLSPERVADVLSCCAQQASGSWQWLLDVAHIEKSLVFAGMGARNGLQAVLLVEAGYRGVPDSLDHRGWLVAGPALHGGDGDLEALTDGLDSIPARSTTPPTSATPSAARPSPRSRRCSNWSTRSTRRGRAGAHRHAGPGRRLPRRGHARAQPPLPHRAHPHRGPPRLRRPPSRSTGCTATPSSPRMETVEVVHDPDQETGTGAPIGPSPHGSPSPCGRVRTHRALRPPRAGVPLPPHGPRRRRGQGPRADDPHLGSDGSTRSWRCATPAPNLDHLHRADLLVELIAR
jgi:hypothetical protein